ncbi:UNVERIFIED_CONTAM: LmbE family N-acetylglucosaminyl deacetylase [Brevibacillus sp. OAP136]
MTFEKILVLAPHTDDAELGCGGLIARSIEEGRQVFVATFSTAEESVPEGAPRDLLKHEFFRAISVLEVPKDNLFLFQYPVRRFSSFRQDILEDLVKLRKKVQPDLVLLPSAHDLHQDHQVLSQEGLRACKDASVWGYEMPWNNVSFHAQAFVTLEERFVRRKWEALQAYQSQIELGRPYFTEEFITGLAKLRGTQIKTAWAEAFEVLRVIV